jgi:hypothetical protein
MKVETDIIDSIAVSLITRTSFDTSDNVYGDFRTNVMF